MDDRVNWTAVCIWAAAVGFQYGTALYDLWKRYKRPASPRRIETDFEKVHRGEVINGWKMVISPERFRKNHNRLYVATIMPPWRNDDTDVHSAFRHDLSLLMRFIEDAPDGLQMYVLRLCSPIADVDKTIARIKYNEREWYYEGTCYLTSRTVAVIFPDISRYRYRLVLVDIPSRGHQVITIVSPFGDAVNTHFVTIRRRDLSKNQLSVLYYAVVDTANGDRQWQFCDAIYDIPTSEIGPDIVVAPTASRVMSMPRNNEVVNSWRETSGFPPIVVVYSKDAPDAVECHSVVSFYQPSNWQITTLDNWLESFRGTLIGSRFLRAVDAFDCLEPPQSLVSCEIPQLLHFGSRYNDYVCGYENGNAAYANIRYEGGVMRRWINPPSLKYLAAEAVCRANPKVSMTELKDRIGCDIFDGMLDKDDAEDGESVVNL